VVEN
jgi:hypothetical protein